MIAIRERDALRSSIWKSRAATSTNTFLSTSARSPNEIPLRINIRTNGCRILRYAASSPILTESVGSRTCPAWSRNRRTRDCESCGERAPKVGCRLLLSRRLTAPPRPPIDPDRLTSYRAEQPTVAPVPGPAKTTPFATGWVPLTASDSPTAGTAAGSADNRAV